MGMNSVCFATSTQSKLEGKTKQLKQINRQIIGLQSEISSVHIQLPLLEHQLKDTELQVSKQYNKLQKTKKAIQQ